MTVKGKPGANSRRAIREIRKFALSFPETREDHPWEHSAFKVKGKTFVFVAADKEGLGLSMKLEESHSRALEKPFASPTRYGLGKHGWVSARFGPKDDVPIDLLKRWIEESFYAIAPLSVLKRLEDGKKK
jgi:predicted DNA-binding protein (MmcQ/YjbR family)